MELRAYRHPLERDAALQRRRPRWGGGEEEALEETLRDSGGGRREAATGWGGGRGGEAHGAGRRVKKFVIRGGGEQRPGCGGSLEKPRLDRGCASPPFWFSRLTATLLVLSSEQHRMSP
jgi:hypothetical protein